MRIDNKVLLHKLSDNLTSELAQTEDTLYHAGLLDGIKLAGRLGLISAPVATLPNLITVQEAV